MSKRSSLALLVCAVSAFAGMFVSASGATARQAHRTARIRSHSVGATSCAALDGIAIPAREIGLPTAGAVITSATLDAAAGSLPVDVAGCDQDLHLMEEAVAILCVGAAVNFDDQRIFLLWVEALWFEDPGIHRPVVRTCIGHILRRGKR